MVETASASFMSQTQPTAELSYQKQVPQLQLHHRHADRQPLASVVGELGTTYQARRHGDDVEDERRPIRAVRPRLLCRRVRGEGIGINDVGPRLQKEAQMTNTGETTLWRFFGRIFSTRFEIG